MMTCSEAQKHLPLYSRGDVDQSTGEAVGRHVESCPACALELTEYKSVISLVRGSFEADLGMPSATRTKIALLASERVARHPWWARLLPMPGHQALAAAAPAFLVLLAIALPLALRSTKDQRTAEGPVRIDMRAEGGIVHLAWTDGRGKPYRVYKSTDPRQLGRGPAQEVRGNEWVDAEPNQAPIVFYRVE